MLHVVNQDKNIRCAMVFREEVVSGENKEQGKGEQRGNDVPSNVWALRAHSVKDVFVTATHALARAERIQNSLVNDKCGLLGWEERGRQ
jgi:hypothetical protein